MDTEDGQRRRQIDRAIPDIALFRWISNAPHIVPDPLCPSPERPDRPVTAAADPLPALAPTRGPPMALRRHVTAMFPAQVSSLPAIQAMRSPAATAAPGTASARNGYGSS